VTGSLEVSQNITASDIIYTSGLAITGADDTFTITGTAADFKVDIEGDLFVAEGLTVEGSNSTITFNGGVVNGVPQKVEEWSQVFVHNGTDAQLSFSLSESVTSANVKFDDDVEVGSDLTVTRNGVVTAALNIGTNAKPSHALSVNGSTKISQDLTIQRSMWAKNLPSGSTEPASVKLGELWLDTDDRTIKVGT
jgi:hypothetical protein